MKLGAFAGLAAGLALSAWLLHSFGALRILHLVLAIGLSGLALVIALHTLQLALAGLAWRIAAGRTRPRPTRIDFLRLRWIREAVGALLPAAGIAGELAGASLLARLGVPPAEAAAGTLADLTLEALSQIVFTLIGLLLLLATIGADAHTAALRIAAGLAVTTVLVAGFLVAQVTGAARGVERLLPRLARLTGWTGLRRLRGLHAALARLYADPPRMARAGALHLLAWLLGGAEICLIGHLLHHEIGAAPGLVIESLSQALKISGVVVPGGIGVIEGGMVAIGAMFGLAPDLAISVALVKRVRDVVLGVPALVAWRVGARRRAVVRA